MIRVMDEKKKDPAAVRLGRRGGEARARKLSAEERSTQARRAVAIRWERYRAKKRRTDDTD